MKSKGKNRIALVLCALVIVFLCITGVTGLEINGYRLKPIGEVIVQGLDLQGGVAVVMEITDDDVTKEVLENTKEQLALRADKLGVAENVVTTEGDNRIRIEIPGADDSSSVVSSLQQQGKLTFKSPNGDVLLTGSDVDKATATTDSNGSPQVSLKMNSEGKTKFAEATKAYLNQTISIYMDDEELTSPTVQSEITNGEAVITGNYTLDEAKNLAALINAGALPVTLKTASVQTIGAQLGEDAIPNAILAGVVGVGLVFLFMILSYRVLGLMASFALSLFIYLVFIIFAEVGVTLTLPGIAALLLTVGMAVDANVLIFERIREEIRRGVPAKGAVTRGFDNAFSSIIDSNVTTILAALVLYALGSGSVKGFAITLMIGIIISLFTSLTVTRFLIKRCVESGFLNKPACFRVKEGNRNEK